MDGPFVVGAHSYGATVATLLTQAHPDAVLGLVFVDPQPPSQSADWLAALPPRAEGESPGITAWRDDIEGFQADPSMNAEHVHLRDSFDAATAALDAPGPLFGDRPVIVLQAERTPNVWHDLPPELESTFTAIWSSAQQALADESTAGSLQAVPDTGHNIQVEAPTAVITALESVLADLR